MLIHGTCNPVGEEDGYGGVYLSKSDLQEIVRDKTLEGKPVLMEHGGDALGHVKTAWLYRDQLDVIVEVDRSKFAGRLAGTFVEIGALKDFSLGYKVNMSAGGNVSGSKKMVELSLVKKGARPNCQIKNIAM